MDGAAGHRDSTYQAPHAQIRGKECTNYVDKRANLFKKQLVLLRIHVGKKDIVFWSLEVSPSLRAFGA